MDRMMSFSRDTAELVYLLFGSRETYLQKVHPFHTSEVMLLLLSFDAECHSRTPNYDAFMLGHKPPTGVSEREFARTNLRQIVLASKQTSASLQ